MPCCAARSGYTWRHRHQVLPTPSIRSSRDLESHASVVPRICVRDQARGRDLSHESHLVLHDVPALVLHVMLSRSLRRRVGPCSRQFESRTSTAPLMCLEPRSSNGSSVAFHSQASMALTRVKKPCFQICLHDIFSIKPRVQTRHRAVHRELGVDRFGG